MTSTNIQPSQQMISSSFGAILVALFTTPFEVIKVRMQAQLKPTAVKCSIFENVVDTLCYCTTKPAFNSPVLCTIHSNIQTVPPFRSSTDAFMKIVQREGVFNLWKGLSATLVQMLPQTVIYYTAYDQMKVWLGFMEGKQNVSSTLVAGVTSRSFAVICVSPIEMIRTKFQSKSRLGYKEMCSMILFTIKQDGVFSMWRGVGPTLLRDVPFSALYWLSYEKLKSLNSAPNFLYYFMAGALSGVVAAVATQPFDVVKTYRQIELGEIKDVSSAKKLPFTFSILNDLRKVQGMSSLYTGMNPRLLKVAPACAIMISTYEYGKSYFAKKNDDRDVG